MKAHNIYFNFIKLKYYNFFFVQVILSIFINLFSIDARGQDAQFSQFYNSPLTMNPSQTGAFNGDFRLLANYRDQWGSISSPYKTFAFSYDMGLMKKKRGTGFLGAGISFLNDRAGTSQLGLNQLNLSLAYHLSVSDNNTLSAGIMGGFAQRHIDFNNLKWTSEYNGDYDSNIPSGGNNKLYADFGSGIQWSYTNGGMNSSSNNQLLVNAGIAVFHVNRPNTSFFSTAKENLPAKLVFHGNAQIGFSNTRYSIVPSFLYTQQGASKDIIAGCLLRIKLQEESKYTSFVKGSALSLGCDYRIGDAIIPQLEMEFEKYAIGVSYDVNTSGLSIASSGRGGLEISLRFINPNPFAGTSSSKTSRFFY
jgi:type IX secretion system PorP/SprF family membrane protein